MDGAGSLSVVYNSFSRVSALVLAGHKESKDGLQIEQDLGVNRHGRGIGGSQRRSTGLGL